MAWSPAAWGYGDSALNPALNRLTTGSLTATDLQNSETYRSSQLSVGGGLTLNGGGSGATSATGPDANGRATSNTASNGASSGINVRGLGTVAPTLPVALSAGGRQSGETLSAIAPATVVITSGDATSIAQAARLTSVDTATANDGALTQAFTNERRQEIAAGFEAAGLLANQTSVFFTNRAAEQAAEQATLDTLGTRGADGTWTPRSDLTPEQRASFTTAQGEYNRLNTSYGATSPARLIATAINGAAGSNVGGSLTSLVRGAAVNVIQSLAVTQVRRIADSLLDARGNPTLGSEGVRAALQAVVGCAGAAAGGNDCTSGATGAASSVVINYLLTAFIDPAPRDINGNLIPRSLTDQAARTNTVATITALIAGAAGLDAATAVTAATIETENNANAPGPNGQPQTICPQGDPDPNCRSGNFITPSQYKDQAPGSQARIQYEQARDRLAEVGVTDDTIISAILSITDFGSLVSRQESTGAAIDQAITTYRQVLLRNPNATPDRVAYAVGELGRATIADVALIGTAENLLFYLSQGNTLNNLRALTPAQQAQARLDVVAACGTFFCSPTFGVSRGDRSALIPGQDTVETAISNGVNRGTEGLGGLLGSAVRSTGLTTAGNITEGVTIGSLDAVTGFLGGIYNLGAHPINTAIGLSQTFDAIGLYSLQSILGQRSLTSDIAARYSPSTGDQGATGVARNASHDVVTVLTLFIGGEAAAGRAGEAGNVARTGEAANAGRVGEVARGAPLEPLRPTNVSGTGTATVDARPPLVPTNVTVTFENVGSRLTAAELNAGFTTDGTTAKAEDTLAGQQLIVTIQSSGVSAERAIGFADNIFLSGVRPPAAVQFSVGDPLFRLVPRGVNEGGRSPYFLTQAELTTLTRNPGQLANRLGLPPGSVALQYDVYRVEALANTTVFQSRIAPTVNTITGARTPGGATQTIVGNRGQFTDPVRVGTINAFNPLPRRGN